MNKDSRWHQNKEKQLLLAAWIVALVFLLIAWILFIWLRPVSVSFLDVGQGDACLIQAGKGGTVLIDSGDGDQGDVLLDYFSLQNISGLDAVILSHFHEDHVLGALGLLRNHFPIGCFYISEYESGTELEQELMQLASERNIPVFRLRKSEEISLGKARYRVIGQEEYRGKDNINNMSMVLRVEYGATAFLFTGDLERGAAKRLAAAEGEALKADVLKVPHHGGISSVQEDFIDACDPTWAIISVGAENSYGEPSGPMLSYLRKRDVGIWRTDRDGTVVMILGKNGIRNITYYRQWG